MEMVLLVIHHLLQVVIVGYRNRYMVRVCPTEIGLSIVSNIIAILIPVERVVAWGILYTIHVTLGIVHFLVEFPSTTCYLVGTRCYGRRTQRDRRSWQDDTRFGDVLNVRNTALELQVDIHYVALGNRCDVHTRLITFLVVVLVNHGDNLILRKVEDVRVTRYIERTGFHRNHTMDGEALLLVG